MKAITKTKKRVCFVHRLVHYALLDNTGTLVGGAEMQQKFLADALAARGWKIYFVTEQTGDKKIINVGLNQTLYPVLKFSGGNKYLRKIFTVPYALWKILRYIDSDIYYQRDTNYMAGIVAMFCKVYHKKFIFAGANNWNFDRGNDQNLNNPLDRISAEFAIKFADKIIVQSMFQGDLLKSNYNRHGVLFYNIFPPKSQSKNGRYILWVGRIVKHKNPNQFIELAKSLPMYHFVMVGGRGSNLSLKLEIEEQAAKLKNVEYLGHQSFETVEDFFDRASIFIGTYNTSTEGFPNTFLQAWSRGIPVVSSMDLDSLISKNNLGIVAESTLQMKKAIELLMNRDNFVKYASSIQEVFNREFSAPNRIKDFERVLVE